MASSTDERLARGGAAGAPASVHDEQLRSARTRRAVRPVAVGDDVRVARAERDAPAVAELGHQLAVEHEQDVAALAPVVRDIPRRVVDLAHADVADLAGPPGRGAGSTRMGRGSDARPVD